jgi:patatin-like phospholipase/acyl hydrolase
MKEVVVTNWGALESVVTSVTGVVGSMSFMWWRQNKLEREQAKQTKEDSRLKDKMHELELQIKSNSVTHNTKAMENMGQALKMFAESNTKKDIILDNVQRSLDTAHRRIDKTDDKIDKVKEDFIHKDNCASKMRNLEK